MSSPFTVTPLDPQIMVLALPEDIHATVNQVTANVNQSLDKMLAEFKATVQKQAEDFKTKALPAELQQELDKLADDYAATLNGNFSGELAAVRTSLAAALAASNAAGAAAPALVNSVQMLNANVQALETKLNDMRASIRKLGENTSRLAVGTALKVFTGV